MDSNEKFVSPVFLVSFSAGHPGPQPGNRTRFVDSDTFRRMRVLGTVQSYFPFQERGGPVFKVRSLARGSGKRGHEVTVLTADLGFRTTRHGPGRQRSPWGWRSRRDGVEDDLSLYFRPLSGPHD